MRYFSPFAFLLFAFSLNFSACDNKEKVKYVAKTAYDELNLKYKNLQLKNRLLKKENIKLNNENELLQHDLKKYKNGFKSMYE